MGDYFIIKFPEFEKNFTAHWSENEQAVTNYYLHDDKITFYFKWIWSYTMTLTFNEIANIIKPNNLINDYKTFEDILNAFIRKFFNNAIKIQGRTAVSALNSN